MYLNFHIEMLYNNNRQRKLKGKYILQRGDTVKNNILLILAVALISVGIIVATVLVSTAGHEEESSSDTTTAATTTAATTETEPVTTSQTTTQPVPQEIIIPNEDTSYDEDMAHSITATARSLIGIDFVDGGDHPDNGFDNSGFIYYVLRENGYITCPRGVEAQSEMGAALSYDELRAGDLAYFYDEEMKAVQFGGIYCGDGIMIACLMPGTKVKEVNISTNYYKSHFYRGVSLT